MKKIKNIEKFTDKDWVALASLLSGEQSEFSNESGPSLSEDRYNTEFYWKEFEKMGKDKEINVDKAWTNLHCRIKNEVGINKIVESAGKYTIHGILRIAAVITLIIALGWTALYLNSTGTFSKKISAVTGDDQKNMEVTLSDGSKVILNHDTKLTYPKNFGKGSRQVKLTGEALFDITHDDAKPFIIDAGKAKVKVLGTSFNVITNNGNNAVEVFVKTGMVLLLDNLEKQNLTIEPGYLGVMNSQTSEKHINNDQNYMAWNTNILVYNGEKLKVVFNDLKRVYNMELVADDPEILDKTISTPFDNLPKETIVKLICATFTLDFEKKGGVYHLSMK
jgi:transmembrane sensor